MGGVHLGDLRHARQIAPGRKRLLALWLLAQQLMVRGGGRLGGRPERDAHLESPLLLGQLDFPDAAVLDEAEKGMRLSRRRAGRGHERG